MFKLPKLLKSKWFPFDAIMILDVLLNAINHEAYYAVGSLLNVEPSTVNSVVSLLEIARLAMLAHQARV